jgi:hypothetical protein
MSGDRYTLTALARDLDVGSRLLARRAALLAAAGYRRCRTLATTGRPGAPSVPRTPPAPTPPARTPSPEKGEGAPTDAPLATAPGKKPEKGRAAATARARGKAADTWLLTGLSAWVVWCFLRRPLAAGLHALLPDLVVLAPFAAVWWSVAAWFTAQHDKHRQAQQPAPSDPVSEQADSAGGQAESAPTREAVQAAEQWLHHLVISRVLEAARQGRKGVHLNTLTAEPGIPATWRVGTLKAHLERLAIPVTRNLKLKGAPGPTYGVREDALVGALGMSLEQAVLSYAPGAPDTLPPAPQGTPTTPSPPAPAGPAGEAPRGAHGEHAFAHLIGALTGPAARPSRTPDATPSPAASQPRPGGG